MIFHYKAITSQDKVDTCSYIDWLVWWSDIQNLVFWPTVFTHIGKLCSYMSTQEWLASSCVWKYTFNVLHVTEIAYSNSPGGPWMSEKSCKIAFCSCLRCSGFNLNLNFFKSFAIHFVLMFSSHATWVGSIVSKQIDRRRLYSNSEEMMPFNAFSMYLFK